MELVERLLSIGSSNLFYFVPFFAFELSRFVVLVGVFDAVSVCIRCERAASFAFCVVFEL